MNPIESLSLLIDIAEIKKKASRHGSMSQRWWQNRIYGLQFGTHSEPTDRLRLFVREAVINTEMALENPKVTRTNKNNLRGFLNGLRDAKLAIEQQAEHAQANP
jgi:hypothetical protein